MISTMATHHLRSPLAILLILAIAFAGCRKGEPAGPGGGGGGGGEIEQFITVTVDGVTYTINEDTENWTPNPHMYDFGSGMTYFSGFAGTATAASFFISFGTLASEGVPTGAEFTSFFAPGERPLASSGGTGATIEHITEDGIWFSSACTFEIAEGSVIITNVLSISGPDGQQMVVNGTFNATLFPCMAENDAIELTNGSFRLIYNNY